MANSIIGRTDKLYKVIEYREIDKDLSEQIKLGFEIYPNSCYENVCKFVFNIAENMSCSNVQIAYGYYGKMGVCMTRHCFLMIDGNVVDPTSYEVAIKERFSYQIFKLFSIKEYVEYCIRYYNKCGSENELAPWFEYFIPEEREYRNYLIEKQILVHSFSYENFLKKYENSDEMCVVK